MTYRFNKLIMTFGLIISCLIITCSTHKPTFVQTPVEPNPVLTQLDKDLCDKAEICTRKMVDNFNYQELKDSSGIKEVSCKIVGFVCNHKEAVVGLRIHLDGVIQQQCINATILIEGGIHYNQEKDTCDIKVKSTVYEDLSECGIEIKNDIKNPS